MSLLDKVSLSQLKAVDSTFIDGIKHQHMDGVLVFEVEYEGTKEIFPYYYKGVEPQVTKYDLLWSIMTPNEDMLNHPEDYFGSHDGDYSKADVEFILKTYEKDRESLVRLFGKDRARVFDEVWEIQN